MNEKKILKLCSQIYESTGWAYESGTNDAWYLNKRGDYITYATFVEGGIPKYSTDYLLSKLPKKIVHDSSKLADQDFWLVLSPGNNGWYACYSLNAAGFEERYIQRGDTPLEVILNLTISLIESGEDLE